MNDTSSKDDSFTVSTRAVEIPDIALWIYFLIENDRDSASFSAIRRNVYDNILQYRLKNAVIHVDHLLSFALLLQRNKRALRHCTSLRVIEPPPDNYTGIFDINKALSRFCMAFTLKTIGENGYLRHFSGNIDGWFPETRIQVKTVAHQTRYTRQISAHVVDVKASKEEFKSAQATVDLMGDQLTTDLPKRLSDAGIEGNPDDFQSTRSVLDELGKSSALLEELCTKFSIEVWRFLCAGSLPALRRLQLEITGSINPGGICLGFQMPPLVQPFPLGAFASLEALKITIHNRQSPVRLPLLHCPRLRLFEIGGNGGHGGSDGELERSLSETGTFVQNHPTLDALSLGNHFVSTSVKGPQNLRAIQYIYSKRAAIPKLPVSIRLPSIGQARVELQSQALFFAEIPSKDDVRHVRCLELSFQSSLDSKYMLEESSDSDVDSHADFEASGEADAEYQSPLIHRVSEVITVFSNLVELGVHLRLQYEYEIDIVPDSDIIRKILMGCRDSETILAVRFKNTASHTFGYRPVDSFDIFVGPPNLRFVCIDTAEEGKGELYDVKTKADGVGKLAVRRSSRKKLPAEGKWTVDFTDESIFNHLTGDYASTQR